jgi:hypothetical protein
MTTSGVLRMMIVRTVTVILLLYLMTACSSGWMDCSDTSCKAGFYRIMTETGVTLTTPNGGSFSYSSSPSDLALQHANEAIARLTALLEARQPPIPEAAPR